MFTVVVGWASSGASRIRRPFGSRYSVMPSTAATRSARMTGAAAGGGAALLGRAAKAGTGRALRPAKMKQAAPVTRLAAKLVTRRRMNSP